MVLEELKLVSIEGFQKGGSTKPLLIQAVNNNGKISPYVLKLYKRDTINQIYSVAKEIIVNEMAREFELPVPDHGVINFDHSVLKDYYSPEHIKTLDKGYKYCSKFNEGTVIYNPSVKNNFLRDYDFENVFAFDNLVLNVDRGGHRNKPNLLVSDDCFLLIDHELTLPFYANHQISSNINFKRSFLIYDYQKHIFWSFLKRKLKKKGIFDEFEQNLQNFDLKIIDSIFANLNIFNVENNGKLDCLDYIKWCKSNIATVVKTLRDRIV